jgi:GTP cyclohydrolase II
VRLLTNNAGKQRGLAEHGLEIMARVPLESEPTRENRHYLTAKASAGHTLSVLTLPARTA